MKQLDYMTKVANMHLNTFLELGHAIPGNNGPYVQAETPARNTSHYLIVYSYLYKTTCDERYAKVSSLFASYLISEQAKTKSGAIQCMYDDGFDRINGLIGQAWAIEALLYYYEVFSDIRALEAAHNIFSSQDYNYDLHTWIRVDIDGERLGVDYAYNHSVWFAACCLPLLELESENELAKMLDDFLTEGVSRDFRIYNNGLLKHLVSLAPQEKNYLKYSIKKALYPIRRVSPKKLDMKYSEQGYHLFDMYGFCILRSAFPSYPFFDSKEFRKAANYALDIDLQNRKMYVNDYLAKGKPHFNKYGWPYNSPAFEYPFVAACLSDQTVNDFDNLFDIQADLMLDTETKRMSKNNPDIETFEARSYEIIRYLDLMK